MLQRYFPLVTLFLAGQATFAQPTLNAGNNLPSAGSEYLMSSGNFVYEGSVGASNLYGFWMLNGTGNRNISYVSPSVSSTVVPNANLLSTDGGSDTLFWRGGASGLELMGEKGGLGTIIYTDPVQELVYPLTYQTSWTDALSASYNVSGFPVTRTGTLTGVADGYGTLQLPLQEINNVLRVRVRKATTDVSPIITIDRISNTYYYFVDTVPHPVLRLQIDTAITGGGNPGATREALWLYGNGLTSIGELNPDDVKFIAYPNPTNGPVNLRFEESGDRARFIDVLDATGRIVLRKDLGRNNVSDLQGALHVEGLAPGVYQLRVQSTDRVLGSTSLIVQ